MIKLRMISTGPNGNYRIGQSITVDKKRADALIAGGHAEMWTPETTSLEPTENAALPRVKKWRSRSSADLQ